MLVAGFPEDTALELRGSKLQVKQLLLLVSSCFPKPEARLADWHLK